MGAVGCYTRDMRRIILTFGGWALAMLSGCGMPETLAPAPTDTPVPPSLISPLESPLPNASVLDQYDLLYSSLQGGARHIFRKRPGAQPRQLTLSGIVNAEPRWSPDGKRIAYMAHLGGDRYEVYLMDADGSNPRRLLQRDFGYNWAPSWSPDGRLILFSSNRDGLANLYLVELDGRAPRRLTDEGNNFLGVWSPDGKRIAFTSDRRGEGDNEIYVMSADGSRLEQLTDNAVDDAAPAWSPDGRYIAYHSYQQGAHNIYVYDLQQRRTQALTREGYPVRHPSWTPDGRFVLATQQVGLEEYVGVVIAFPSGQIVERLPGAEWLQARRPTQ